MPIYFGDIPGCPKLHDYAGDSSQWSIDLAVYIETWLESHANSLRQITIDPDIIEYLSNLTEGSVLFGGTDGAIAEDNTNFSYDDATNALTVAGTVQAGDLISDDDITMSGLFTNTPAATDASVVSMDGDANARTFAGGSETVFDFKRTIAGASSTVPNVVTQFNNNLTMSYNFDSGAATSAHRYLRGMYNRYDHTGDWEITSGVVGANHVHLRAVDNLVTTTNDNLLEMSAGAVPAKSINWYMYGSNNEALFQSSFDIQTGSITGHIYGGKFKAWGSGLNRVSGTLVANYYGGYFEVVGDNHANVTETCYAGYFTATGGDTNYGIYVAAGISLFNDKVLFTQTDGNEYIDSLADGYMDYGATTAHRFNNKITVTGAGSTFGGNPVPKRLYLNLDPRPGTGTLQQGGMTLLDGEDVAFQTYIDDYIDDSQDIVMTFVLVSTEADATEDMKIYVETRKTDNSEVGGWNIENGTAFTFDSTNADRLSKYQYTLAAANYEIGDGIAILIENNTGTATVKVYMCIFEMVAKDS